jgi:GMP synthase PP-ATPase subunit
VAQGLVLSAVSGGVDSSVATALASGLGEQVYSVFIDTGYIA